MRLGSRRQTPAHEKSLHIIGNDLRANPEEDYAGSPVPPEKAAYTSDHPRLLGEDLAKELNELANRYDRLDHDYNNGKGTIIQEDCLAIRAIADRIETRS